MEESAIAKGIRRIVAVTGEEAVKAQLLAKEYASKVTALGKSQGSPTFERDIKSLGSELDQAVIPILEKAALKTEFAAIKKAFLDAEKTRLAQETKEVLDKVKQFFAENPEKKILVKRLETSSGKAMSQALVHVKGLKDCAAFFFVVDELAGKVTYQCCVPASMTDGLKANEWAGAVAQVLGGKSGGKTESAMGSGEAVGKIDEAIAAAVSFAGC